MTTRTQVRNWIDATFPWLASCPLDHAIREVRRLRIADAAYYASLNRSASGGRHV